MTRHVHGVYAPAGDAAYAAPNGEIVRVPQDFAFADTVVALDEEIPTAPVSRPPPSMPPSRPPPSHGPASQRPPRSHPPPASYRDAHTRQHELAALQQQQQLHAMQQQQMQQMQAYAHAQGSVPPGPIDPQDGGLVTSFRGAVRRAKHTLDSSRGEMRELWSATETTDPAMNRDEKDPIVRLARRVRTFWSFFEWDKDDVARAAWIGLAVFVIAVCAAFVLR